MNSEYFTHTWTSPVYITSLDYSILDVREPVNYYKLGVFKISFSDNSYLTISAEVDKVSGLCDKVIYFDTSEIYGDKIPKRDIPTYIVDDKLLVNKFTICHFVDTADESVSIFGMCNETLYIDIDNKNIPYFGFKSLHNGYYASIITVCYVNSDTITMHNQRYFL